MTQIAYFGVIPARGGSKRIPGKNLALLNGRPLIDYTLAAARESKRLNAYAVSTDSEEIAARAATQGVVVPELRPARISDDRSPVVAAIQHAVECFERQHPVRIGAVVLLQPTSPLRTGRDIDRAIEIFERTGADTVTAVRTASDHPYWVWRDEAQQGIRPYFSLVEMAMDRKDLPAAYAENGAVYVVRREVVDSGRIYGERIAPFVMDEVHSIDIDEPLDLAWAQFVVERGMIAR